MTPVEFYAARLDELEALARLLAAPYMFFEDWAALSPGEIDYVKTLNPAYVLADIAAKRATLRLAEQQFQPHAVMDGMGWEQYENGLTAAYRAVVAHLVQPFAAHPDFDESWKL